MRTIEYPEKPVWESLCVRPGILKDDLESVVSEIIEGVKNDRDEALYYYSQKFDGVRLSGLKVTEQEIREGAAMVPDELKKAIRIAAGNIEKFHRAQKKPGYVTETTSGVKCWQKSVPIEKVGLYIPGGSAPLFSTVLMLGIPAVIAGCSRIIMCTPPDINGRINPAILYAAEVTGIKDIFRTGGAQAIAAMAYGTESVPAVSKIFGPGNQYVTKAKELIQQDGIPIDMPAGPSEVLIIADRDADPGFIAADLLSQAEHGPDSQVVLVTDSAALPYRVMEEVRSQLADLPRKDIAARSLDNSMSIVLSSMEDCLEFSNLYAPEHLIINTADYMNMAEGVKNAGSVFLGPYSCESAGDYASGTNHTLPTNRFAINYGGVSVQSFQKDISFQVLSEEGIRNLGPVIEIMAEAENLRAHSNAVSIRLKKIKND